LGLGAAAMFLVPARALGRHATSHPEAAAASASKCSYVSYDNKADAPDLRGQQANQLDVVKATLGLNRARTKLRLVMTFKNLSKTPPSPATYMDYQFSWTNPSGDRGPNALDASVTGGGVTYTAGTVSGSVYTPSSTTTATGTFGHGPGGAIEIDAPLRQLGLKVGQVLSQPVTNTYSGVSSPVVSYGQGSDSDTGAHYKLGQPTCIDPRRR
jgi:hypothetical protein